MLIQSVTAIQAVTADGANKGGFTISFRDRTGRPRVSQLLTLRTGPTEEKCGQS